MAWQDRDYKRKRPDDSNDEFIDSSDAPSDDEFEEDHGAEDEVDESDRSDGDEPSLVRCPNCRKMIIEDAEQCPKCGHYILDEELSAGRPLWMWIGLGLALMVAVMWAIFG